MTRRSHGTARRTRGFTLVEVMISIAIITMGSVALMSMIHVASRGNAQARLITNASENTQLWVDRLQRVAMGWTTNSQTSVTGLPYLDKLKNAQTTGWFIPDAAAGADGIAGMSWQGTPVGLGGSPFCTLLNLSWISVGRSIRAEVITYYARRPEDAVVAGTGTFSCTAAGSGLAIVNELAAPASSLAGVRAATVLRWRPL